MKKFLPALLVLMIFFCSCENEGKTNFELGVSAMEAKDFAAAVSYFEKAGGYHPSQTKEYLDFSRQMLDIETSASEASRQSELEASSIAASIEDERIAREKLKKDAEKNFPIVLGQIKTALEEARDTGSLAVETLNFKKMNTTEFKKKLAGISSKIIKCDDYLAAGAEIGDKNLTAYAFAKKAHEKFEKARKSIVNNSYASSKSAVAALVADVSAAVEYTGKIVIGQDGE